MAEYSFTIGKSQWNEDAVRNFSMGMAAAHRENLVHSEEMPGGGLYHGSYMQAVQNAEGAVFARLVEYRLDNSGTCKLRHVDEHDGIPHGNLAPLKVLLALSPSENHVALIWRDLSRKALVDAGVFNKLTSGQSADHNTDKNGKGEARELTRQEPQRVRQQAEAGAQQQSAAGTQQREDGTGNQKKSVRLLCDQVPEVKTSTSKGSKYLKFTGFLVEGAKGFVNVVVFRGAEEIVKRIADAIESGGMASLKLDGQMQKKGKYTDLLVDTVGDILPTEERPDAMTKSSRARQNSGQAPQESAPAQAQDRDSEYYPTGISAGDEPSM